MASKPVIPSPPIAPTSASTSRRQPMRQARTARKNPANSKLGGRGGATNGVNGQSTLSHTPPAKFYPALSQFTDATDALPAEAIRHFTLLREVDAKACGPEANLRFLIESAQSLVAPEDPYEYDPALEALKTLDELQQRRDEFHAGGEASLLHQLEAIQASEGPGSKTILGHPETRRARFAQIRAQISDLLKTQDEKIHVITTAHEALQKHLQRIDHTYGYVQMEIPDLYRLGSKEHWAYKDPVKRGTAAAHARAAEKALREAEERHSQQQREIETSNTRSETRREALARQKAAAAAAAAINEEEEQIRGEQNYQQHQQHQQPAKKLHGNSKIRKEQEALASAKRMAEHQSATGGGGLLPAPNSIVPPTPQPTKRRKTANIQRDGPGATMTEKPSTGEPSAKVIASPRIGTPSAANKRKSGASTGGPRGGRRNPGGPAASPNLASSPIHPTFPMAAGLGRDITLAAVGKPADKQQDAPLSSRSAEASAKTAAGSKAGKRDKEKEKGVSKDEDKMTATGVPGREAKFAVPPPDSRDAAELAGKSAEDTRGAISEDTVMTSTVEKAPSLQPADGGSKSAIAIGGEPPVEKPLKKRKESIPSNEATYEMSSLEMEKPAKKDSDRKHVEVGEKEKKRKRAVHDDHENVPASAPPTITEERHSRPQYPTSVSAKTRPSTSDGVPTAQPVQAPSSGTKRQHRKRADSSAAAMSSSAKMKVEEPEEELPAAEDDADADAEEDADEDEPVYCYCQQISYGEMVACDGENCPKEWFHLECVGLAQAPRGKAKWYCSDCKDSMTRGRRMGSKA